MWLKGLAPLCNAIKGGESLEAALAAQANGIQHEVERLIHAEAENLVSWVEVNQAANLALANPTILVLFYIHAR